MSATTGPTSRFWPLDFRNSFRHRGAIVVGLTILLSLVVRVRLCTMPLERDEGEYAYAGQLILQGVPPYKEAYNLKLPGTYAAYAVIMALLGQSPAAIHLGLAAINAISIWLMYLVGRRLLDEVAGAGAAVAFGVLSLSPSVLGLAAHATHFVAVFALAGLWCLLRAEELGFFGAKSSTSLAGPSAGTGFLRSRNSALALAGLSCGLALLMKQHGVFFGVFGGLYLIWTWVSTRFGWEQTRLENWRKTRKGATGARRDLRFNPSGGAKPVMRVPFTGGASEQTPPVPSPGLSPSRLPLPASRLFTALVIFSGAFVLPYVVACVVLAGTGAWNQFVFWTFSYAAKYASAIPMINGPEIFRTSVNAVVGPNLVFWILPWVGMLVLWWEDGLSVDHRFFLVALTLCTAAAISLGFYFRQHYFILWLPALSLLSGVAASRGLHLLRKDNTIELFLAVPMVGLNAVGLLAALIGNGMLWFGMSPAKVVKETYGSTLFLEAIKAADYLKANSPPNTRIAVLGSEPEIYFYAHRRSATGYIYVYSLMERQPFARRMQEEMIAEIEKNKPDYVIYVQDDYSWLEWDGSETLIRNWWQDYWTKNLDLVKTIDIEEGREDPLALRPDKRNPAMQPPTTKHLLIYKRR